MGEKQFSQTGAGLQRVFSSVNIFQARLKFGSERFFEHELFHLQNC